MVYVAKGTAGKTTAAAPAKAEGGLTRGTCEYTLKFLPSGAVEGEDGRFPWKTIACIWKQKQKSQKDDSEYYSFSGDSFPVEGDTEFSMTRYKLKADTDGPFLEILEGRRIKKAGAKSADGRQFTQMGDSKIIRLQPIRNKEGKPIPKAFIGVDEVTKDEYKLAQYRTKEEWAEWMANKDKPRVSKAEQYFG